MRRNHVLLVAITCLLLINGIYTRCKLRGRKEKKTISKHQQCLIKGFQSSLPGCMQQDGNLSKKGARKCRRVEKLLKNCDYTCPIPVVTLRIDQFTQKKEESGTATFTCVTNVPKPTQIYWHRFVLNSEGYEDITEMSTQEIRPSNPGWEVKSVLKVEPLVYNDGGNYRCSLMDYPTSAGAFLAVERLAAFALRIDPLTLKKKESETATFTCVTNVPKPTRIYWHRFALNAKGFNDITEMSNQEIKPSDSGWEVKSVLKVGPLVYNDGGTYRCSLMDYPTSAEAFLGVQTKNSIEMKI